MVLAKGGLSIISLKPTSCVRARRESVYLHSTSADAGVHPAAKGVKAFERVPSPKNITRIFGAYHMSCTKFLQWTAAAYFAIYHKCVPRDLRGIKLPYRSYITPQK